MNQSVVTNEAEVPLSEQLQRLLKKIEFYTKRFLRDFPNSAGDLHNRDAMKNGVSEAVKKLRWEWPRAQKGKGLDPAQIGAWAQMIIIRLDEYLNTRVQNKYYLPAWDEVYRLRRRLAQDLPENDGRFGDLDYKCYEIASMADYGLGGRNQVPQSPLMECAKSRIVAELEQGVRSAPVCFADHEGPIVVLLQMLVYAAECGALSEEDMLDMRDFIKIQIEMRPAYKGVDLVDGHRYRRRRALARQNALLKAAAPFFGS